MKLYLFLSIVIIACLLAVMPSYAISADLVQGIAKLKGQLADGTTVKAELRTMKVTPKYPYKHAFMWGGDETAVPKTVITAIDVRIGNEKIFVPLSAYSDLGDPRQTSLENMEHGFKLIITGGDAAVSYKRCLYLTRKTFSAERLRMVNFLMRCGRRRFIHLLARMMKDRNPII